MALTSLSGSSSAVFGTPGIRQPDPNIQPPIDPVDAVAARKKEMEAAANQTGTGSSASTADGAVSAVNTAPTQDERLQALQSGRTRGSFVDIRA